MTLVKSQITSRVPLLAVGAALITSVAVAASIQGTTASAAQSQLRPQVVMQQSFDAIGLPAGTAVGTAARVILPAGLDFKHVHGGPEYVYVISGSFMVTHGEGSTTYNAGDFAFVPGGMPHTASTAEGAEIFVLNLRPVGAEWIIPLQ